MKKFQENIRKKGWKGIIKGTAFCLLAVCLLCVLLPTGTVRADVLIELDDKFWEKNSADCRHVSRHYTVNSPEGYAVLWESPVSSKKKEVVLNGTQIWGEWQYTDEDDEAWLAVEGSLEGNHGKIGVRGWIKTSECLVVPDHISFREAYEQEFVGFDPAYDHAFDDVEQVTVWKYPCSGVVTADNIDARWFREADYLGQIFDTCWKDPKGRMWGYIGYLYGMRNVWICLDDPTGDTIETEEDLLAQDAVIYPPADPNAPKPEETEPTGTEPRVTDVKKKLQQDVVIYPPAEKPPKIRNGVTVLAIAGVLCVVALTAGMIWFFFGRKRKNKDSNSKGAGMDDPL